MSQKKLDYQEAFNNLVKDSIAMIDEEVRRLNMETIKLHGFRNSLVGMLY